MSLPHFLLIGAPKAGTTALHLALSAHPEVFMSTPKEPKFFLTEDGRRPIARGGPGDAQTIRKQLWRRSDYERLFDAAPPGARLGESTTLYLQDPAAHRRIKAAMPDVRLIAVLRDPVDRAHSNWAHLHSAGLEPEPFLRACELEEQRARDGWAPFWGYQRLGRYGEQLRSLFSVFAREQVLVLFYRDLREQPAPTMDVVCRFIGVTPGLVTDVPAANVTAAASPSLPNRLLGYGLRYGTAIGRLVPEFVRENVSLPVVRLLQREQLRRVPVQPLERRLLIPRFEDDIRIVEDLLGIPLPHWRDERYGTERRQLDLTERFGTGYMSIDRPSFTRPSLPE
jgi:hypothetical protein